MTAHLERLAEAEHLRVTVFGDLSLDAYWDVRADPQQVSVETGLVVREVMSQRYTLGGAGNVLVNLRALGVGQLKALGVCGKDPFGARLLEELQALGVDASDYQVVGDDWQTLVYAKPYIGSAEESRIDFGTYHELPQAVIEDLLRTLESAAAVSDAVIINQQVSTSQFSVSTVERIAAIVAKHSDVVFVIDARDLAATIPGAVLKVNCREAAALVGEEPTEILADADAARIAVIISTSTGRPVFLTRGEMGMLVADGDLTTSILPVDVGSRVDPVGAGDCVTATVATMLAAGAAAHEAGEVANLAAAITVKQLQSTGAHAVSPAAIGEIAESDRIYAPGLAADATRARIAPGTAFEIVDPAGLRRESRFRHAIFDHDGTLSTLREGWEAVMAPMMLKAILGPAYGHTSPAAVAEWEARIADFIDRTTGIQTLVQMQGLVELVREAGFVPQAEILDHFGYKEVYNDLLLEQVRGRVADLRAGRLDREDFHIKNAIPLLGALRDAGIILHLASGTDEADVVAEANELGFGEYFGDRIYGSIGDVAHEAKAVVIQRIIRDNHLSGAEIITFGDGPVEMRETRKRGGLAVGVCSDELRRHGFNAAKRPRLIRGGAQLLVGDYSDLTQLLSVLDISPARQRAIA
ncbi:MAG: PfkB family carbohydrate kinase [Propionicimonas sp.]